VACLVGLFWEVRVGKRRIVPISGTLGHTAAGKTMESMLKSDRNASVRWQLAMRIAFLAK
jgi:hypothetical protein